MSDCLTDKERLELFTPMGRPMRQGSPDELGISDKSRVTQALESGDAQTALAYLDLIRSGHLEMTVILFEWVMEWPNALAKYRPDRERGCTTLAFQKWKNAIPPPPPATSLQSDEAVEGLMRLLEPESARPGVSDYYRSQSAEGKETAVSGIIARITGRVQHIQKAASAGQFSEAVGELESYWVFICAIHDGLVQYAQSYPSAIEEELGQEIAERMIEVSFSSCSFFEGLWSLVAILTPPQLAAFLAEHLRFHCSGTGRGGSTEIIEEKDCYRLIFDPCGSGGALRLRLGARIERFKNPTPATWHRSDEVPGYCAHCAFNELQSMKRFGYPLLITAFDPDPLKPCGWTVYKNPESIPDEFFRRLGFRKDPAKFRSVRVQLGQA